jgi:hypothetical protein
MNGASRAKNEASQRKTPDAASLGWLDGSACHAGFYTLDHVVQRLTLLGP